jgi:hypothetical protein
VATTTTKKWKTRSARKDAPQSATHGVAASAQTADAVLAVVCVFAGAAARKRRRDYGEGETGEAESRNYEGFDK